VKRSLTAQAVFGGFDGTSSLLGVIVYLLATHPSLIFPAAASGAVSSALSMGAGEWLSDSENGLAASVVMGAATLTGALLPAVPFAFGSGPAAITVSALLCAAIGYTVARLRTNRGLGLALSETFGLLVVILGITAALAVWLPGGGG
jgi:VIT1/CCC1 family predicted Fe2+/Mn2+ transporter